MALFNNTYYRCSTHTQKIKLFYRHAYNASQMLKNTNNNAFSNIFDYLNTIILGGTTQ